MKTIVLQGVSNSGKTGTVKKMIETLLKKYPNVNPFYHNLKFRHAMTVGTAKGGNVYDVWIAFERNDKKIIIISLGDSMKILEEAYRLILRKTGWARADILLCCGHDTPNFNRFFQRLCGDEIIIVPKKKGSNDDELVSQRLFDLLDQEIRK